MKGTVKWFNDEKGFGFITPEGVESSKENDHFVHYSNIENDDPHTGRRTLVDGQKVEYQVGHGRNGKKEAQHVVVVAK